MVNGQTPVSTLKLTYELGIEARTGRITQDQAKNAMMVLANADDGKITADDLELEGQVYSRLSDENRGLDPQKALNFAQMASGASVARLFLLKGMQDGSIGRLADGIREGSHADFVNAFMGQKPVE